LFAYSFAISNRAAHTGAPSASVLPGESLGLMTTALGASLLAYSFTAGEAARAEAPSTSSAVVVAPTGEDPYIIPDSSKGAMPKTIVLYQYEVCPFCCKVKAFLDYYKIPYRVVEVNPLTKTELKWSEYKKVPVVLLDETDWTNTWSLQFQTGRWCKFFKRFQC